MRNRNTMGASEYFRTSLCCLLMPLALYLFTLFRPIPGMSDTLSTLMFGGLISAEFTLGLSLTGLDRRNFVSIFTNTVIPYGLYFFLSFLSVTPRLLAQIGVTCTIAALGYTLLVFFNYIRSRRQQRTLASVKYCLYVCYLNSRTLTAAVLVLFLLGSTFKLSLERYENAHTADISPSAAAEAMVSENMDTILLLQNDEWDKLNTDDRLAVLQTIADIETARLGIDPLPVFAEELDARTFGRYHNWEKSVGINADCLALESSSMMLTVVCHECYHAYQHALVAAYHSLDAASQKLAIFEDAAIYKYEFENYVDGAEDYSGYASQLCEAESNEYAELSLLRYRNLIRNYLKENTTKDAQS